MKVIFSLLYDQESTPWYLQEMIENFPFELICERDVKCAMKEILYSVLSTINLYKNWMTPASSSLVFLLS